MLLLAVALLALPACSSDPGLPSLVGLPLDEAKATARTAGFSDVVSHDVLRSRSQVVDGNWQVCSQNPGPGPTASNATIDVGVVRTAEACPGTTTTPTTTTTTPAPTTTPSSKVDVDGDLDQPRVPYVPQPDRGSSSSGDGNSGGSAYYRNCAAARAAGAAPLSAGEPGYRLELDSNEDGVACE